MQLTTYQMIIRNKTKTFIFNILWFISMNLTRKPKNFNISKMYELFHTGYFCFLVL